MGQKSDQVVRQILSELQSCCAKGHFSDESPEKLWFWQGHRRVDIKESLCFELPPVYGPPKADLVKGKVEDATSLQVWNVKTEQQIHTRLALKSPKVKAGRTQSFVMKIFDTPDTRGQDEFISQITQAGHTALCLNLRYSEQINDIHELAEMYLGFGKSYAGEVVIDLMRVIDHLEHQHQIEADPIILLLSGATVPFGLALSSIDQRISAIIIDYSDPDDPLLNISGRAPFFKGQFTHLGPNPWLVLAQCSVPKPMTILGSPRQSHPELAEPAKSCLLTFGQIVDNLRQTYQISGFDSRLNLPDVQKTQPNITHLIDAMIEQL